MAGALGPGPATITRRGRELPRLADGMVLYVLVLGTRQRAVDGGPHKKEEPRERRRGMIDYIRRPTADAGTGVILMGP